MFVRNISRILGSIFNPPVCPVCGCVLETRETVFCTKCRWDMPLTEYWLHEQNPITKKFSEQFPIVRGCSLFFYNQNSRWHRPIHLMKYYGHRRIAYEFGKMLGMAIRNVECWQKVDFLVPVPIHLFRRLSREYNQTEEICRGISQLTGIDVDFNSVRRVKYSVSQVGKSQVQRVSNFKANTFKVVNRHKFENKHILLVDDVLTTGTTIKSLAEEILRSVPNVKISIATVAVSSYHLNR